MKTFKNLWESFVSYENLFIAAIKACQRKRYKPAVLEFNNNLGENLLQLQKELQDGEYMPGSYKYFKITEPKERDVYAAPYRDRIVHHALLNVLEPIWEKRFYYHSYACRKEKGMHRAIDICQKYIRQNKYILKCDIRKYFQSIDHKLLMHIIKKRIADKKLLDLIFMIINFSPQMDTPYILYSNDDLFTYFERKKGVPIGNLTSQFFANVFLNELDHWVKHNNKIKHYIRYMDDFLLFHNSKSYLRNVRQQMEGFLDSMRLTLHPQKTQILPSKDGVAFLGFHIKSDVKRLRKANIQRFVKRMKIQQKLYSNYSIDLAYIKQSINAWIGHAGHGDTYKLIAKLLYNYPLKRGRDRNLNDDYKYFANRSKDLPIESCVAVIGTTTQTTTIYARGTATTTLRQTATTTSVFDVPILKKISDQELYGAFGDYGVQIYSSCKRRKEKNTRQLVGNESCQSLFNSNTLKV
ncbi:RNA-dependent DNA polymerase [bacterium]|nr:RNA-dependent DNA polymerase [bacterium]